MKYIRFVRYRMNKMKTTYLEILKNHINAKTSVDNLGLYRELQGLRSEEDFARFVSSDKTEFDLEYFRELKNSFLEIVQEISHENSKELDVFEPIKRMLNNRMIQRQLPISHELLWKNMRISLDIIMASCINMVKRFYDAQKEDSFSFFEWIMKTGYKAIVEEYPVLLLQISSLIDEYIDLINECLTRIGSHRIELQKIFGFDPAEEIIDIKCDVSDRHYLGRSVVIIIYEKHKLVYKPRDMSVDVFWYNVAKWLTDTNTDIEVRAAKVFAGKGYGFVEWIEADKVINSENDETYSYRCGNLLGIITLLGGSDFHYENVICSKYAPVIIDVETLILPNVRQVYATNQEGIQLDVFLQTPFMRTLLLPKWIGNSPENAMDIGGLSAKNVGGKNLPKHNDGNYVECINYPDAFVKGFEDVLNYVLEHKDEYINIIYDVKELQFRYILRNTRVYYKLLKYFSNPIYLKDMHVFQCAVSRAFAPYLLIGNVDITEKMWGIATVEYDELQKYHIPIFGLHGNSTDLLGPDNKVVLKDFFYISPYDYVRHTVDMLNQQLIMKYKTFLCNVISIHQIQNRETYNWQLSYFDLNRKWMLPNEITTMREYCHKILHSIHASVETKILNEELQIYFAPVKDSETGRYSMEIMKDALYGGRYGVQIFLEMFYHYFGYKKDRQLLESYVYEMAKSFYENSNETKWFGLSMTNGLAGLLLLLRNFAIISHSTKFIDLLFSIIRSIPKENIVRYEETDYYNGIAGLLYIISNSYKLFNIEPNQKEKNIISYIVEVLMSRRSENGLWFQAEYYHQPLTGLGHGQSGYLLALSESFSYITDDKLQETVKAQIFSCLEYEEKCFDTSEKNLPDYRKLVLKKNIDHSAKGKKFMYGYCSGILGSSLAISHISQDMIDVMHKDWWRSNSVEYLKKDVFIGNDSLCCGTAGWIDYLSTCHKGEEWSCRLVEKIIYSIKEQGYALNTLKNVDEISLYKGVSGIGYALLRYLGDYPSAII